LEKLHDQHCRKYIYTDIYNHNREENLFTVEEACLWKELKSTVKSSWKSEMLKR